jgi:hypothetical protein
MQRKLITFSTIIFLAFILTGVKAQENINSAGNNATGTGGSVSYSIGQVVYHTLIGTNSSIAEGVQQPYEISVISGVSDSKAINLSLVAFPNPTTDLLTLSFNEQSLTNLTYQLLDLNGKLLRSEKITGNQTTIEMSNLATSTYFLKVIHNNTEIKTFKIVKN